MSDYCNRIRVPVYERICTLTGRPLRIQYAVNAAGAVFRRLWINPVILGRVRRDGSRTQGRWDSWALIGNNLPAEARLTDQFANIPRTEAA